MRNCTLNIAHNGGAAGEGFDAATGGQAEVGRVLVGGLAKQHLQRGCRIEPGARHQGLRGEGRQHGGSGRARRADEAVGTAERRRDEPDVVAAARTRELFWFVKMRGPLGYRSRLLLCSKQA